MSAETSESKPPAPLWAWLFVVACIAIPVLAVGGAVPGAIGGGGAYACYAVARDPRKSVGWRVVTCSLITGGCWALFLIVTGAAVFATT